MPGNRPVDVVVRSAPVGDLRRCAARNLIRSGVAQAVAMCITGHETDAMFRRYNITEADLRDTMQKVTKYNNAEQQKVVSIAK